MVSRISNLSNDDRNAGHNQPDDTSTQGQSLPRSQGTDSVRGTWSSEGEAGHHLGSNATGQTKDFEPEVTLATTGTHRSSGT
jgi:hypothetical protein